MDKVSAEKLFELDKPYTKKDVRKSYKRLAKKWHPDWNLGSGNEEQCRKMMQDINSAKEILFSLFDNETDTVNPGIHSEEQSETSQYENYSNNTFNEYELLYQAAVSLLLRPKSIRDLEKAAYIFNGIKFYKDSAQLLISCLVLINDYYLKVERAQKEQQKKKQDARERYKQQERQRRAREAAERERKQREARIKAEKERKERIRKEKLRKELERKKAAKEFNQKMQDIKDRVAAGVLFDWEITLIVTLIIIFMISIVVQANGFDFLKHMTDFFGISYHFDWKGEYVSDSSSLYFSFADNVYTLAAVAAIFCAIPPFPVVFLIKYLVTKLRKKWFGFSLDPMFSTRLNRALILSIFCPLALSILLPYSDSFFNYLKATFFWQWGNEKLAFELYCGLRVYCLLVAHVVTFVVCFKINTECKNNITGNYNYRFWRYVSRSPILENSLCISCSLFVTILLQLVFII